ncbi:hypothetical protein POM88_043269 [Heracleum sosnowskyi]|uniref:BED-type domain-containing protein n=1 Tax=Heracleum sosnowskyi TaxID=360622 RepID=A0AAD8H371_9APIA|nr:hypothetical protein POM88_043269 [Heracleum sosnowskyi]
MEERIEFDPLGTGASTEPHVPVDTATSVLQKCKPVKLRSNVWPHFDRFKNEFGDKRAWCKYCHKDYTREGANGTSGLTAHLRNCNVYNLASNQSKLSFQTSTEDGVSLQNWTFDKNLCDEMCSIFLIDLIVCCLLLRAVCLLVSELMCVGSVAIKSSD